MKEVLDDGPLRIRDETRNDSDAARSEFRRGRPSVLQPIRE